MGEVSKAVGQWIVANTGWAFIIFLFVLTGLFKIVKIEINPLGWLVGWIGKTLTKDVRNDISDFKKETDEKFKDIQKERKEVFAGYDAKITDLRNDLDDFEVKAKGGIIKNRDDCNSNYSKLVSRIDEMQKSNDMQTVRQIKQHVFEFANSLMNKVKHTKKDFENIIAENQDYEYFVEKYHLINDVYTEDYEFIMKVYHECQSKNSFLKNDTE